MSAIRTGLDVGRRAGAVGFDGALAGFAFGGEGFE